MVEIWIHELASGKKNIESRYRNGNGYVCARISWTMNPESAFDSDFL